MRRLLSALIVLFAIAGPGVGRADRIAAQQAPSKIRIAFLYSDGNLPATLKAYKALLKERPDLKDRVAFTFLTESMFDDVKPQDLASANALVFDVMNEQMLQRFNTQHKYNIIAGVRRNGGPVFAVGEGLLPKEQHTSAGAVYDDTARAFWQHGGFNNQLGLLKLVLSRAGIKGLSVPKPEPSLDFGYYYPDGANGVVFATWEQLAAWKQAHGKTKPGAPRIALGFYKSSYYTGETELLDAIGVASAAAKTSRDGKSRHRDESNDEDAKESSHRLPARK